MDTLNKALDHLITALYSAEQTPVISRETNIRELSVAVLNIQQARVLEQEMAIRQQNFNLQSADTPASTDELPF